MIATAVLIMLAGRLTHLAELNINPILDDRRIATGMLYERMKHMARLSFGNMWTLIEGLRYTIRQQMKTVNIRKEVTILLNYPLVYPKHN